MYIISPLLLYGPHWFDSRPYVCSYLTFRNLFSVYTYALRLLSLEYNNMTEVIHSFKTTLISVLDVCT